RLQLRNALVDRTCFAMSTGQVADAHQELADDLRPREAERLAEEPYPLGLAQRMLCLDPTREAAMRGGELLDLLRVGDGRLDLQPIADDARIGEQALHVALSVAC